MNIAELERVQERATKMIKGFEQLTYKEILQCLVHYRLGEKVDYGGEMICIRSGMM